MTHSFTPHAIAPEYCATCAVHRSQHPQLSAAVPTKAANSELSAAIQNAREAQERAELDHAKACDDKRDTADSLTEERLRGLLRQAEQFIAGFEDDPMQEGIPELLAAIRAEIE